MIPLLKPKLPDWSQLKPYIADSEYCSHYSNFGPCHGSLIDDLSSHYSIDKNSICLFSSATLALSLTILYYKQISLKNKFTVALPSWTFSATAQSAKSVGAEILFFDTDDTGFLNIDSVEQALIDNNDLFDVILCVIPFGSSYRSYLERLDRFYDKYKVPIVIDCAAGFSSVLPSRFPTVVSTHTTKFMPTAEGGFLVSQNYDLVSQITASTNFGFCGSRESIVLGSNAKMSEYHAAVGLAFMKHHLSEKVNSYKSQFEIYKSLLDKYCGNNISVFLNTLNAPVSTFNIKLNHRNRVEIDSLSIKLMRDHGIETRRWWNLPLHLHTAFNQEQCFDEMVNTNTLHNSVMALPFGSHINTQTQHFIIASLAKCLNLS